MPKYRYKNTKTGETTSVIMTIREMLQRQGDGDDIQIDGETWTRDYGAEGKTRVSTSKGWPMYSNSMGTHPDQVKQTQEDLRKMGCGHVEFSSDGMMKLDNNAQRKKIMKAMGMVDRNGYD
jgi:hypothetical protein